MAIEKFIPTSPDLDIRQDSDLAPAKFGHLNRLVDDINAGGLGGGLYQEGEGLNSSVRCGDLGNVASGERSFIANGLNNTASGEGSTVVNGANNIAAAAYSFINGSGNCATKRSTVFGVSNKSFGLDGFINGMANTICSDPTTDHLNTILNGYGHVVQGQTATILGGTGNKILGETGRGNACNAIVTGEGNCIVSCYNGSDNPAETGRNGTNVIGGGRFNCIMHATTQCVNSWHGTLAGGCRNSIIGSVSATVSGGAYNRADSAASLSRQEGQIVAGGVFNTSSISYGSIIGGARNTITGSHSSVSAGLCNTIAGQFSSIQAGRNNTVSSAYSSIFGGEGNVACHSHAGIFGCDITSRMDCAFHTNRIVVTALPSSATGLPIGALYYDPADGNTVKFVSA